MKDFRLSIFVVIAFASSGFGSACFAQGFPDPNLRSNQTGGHLAHYDPNLIENQRSDRLSHYNPNLLENQCNGKVAIRNPNVDCSVNIENGFSTTDVTLVTSPTRFDASHPENANSHQIRTNHALHWQKPIYVAIYNQKGQYTYYKVAPGTAQIRWSSDHQVYYLDGENVTPVSNEPAI